jgi:Uma2 family endonuclease
MATIQRDPTEQLALPVDPRPILLENVRWETYEMLLEDLDESHVRLTYDRGSLEIMSPSSAHERYAYLFERLIDALAEELEISLDGLRTTTCRRVDLERGLEPDACFYIANERLVRGKARIDFSVDPPPDLAIEMDISRSSLGRLGIYASLGVPEVWRFDGETLQVFHLDDDGRYVESASSRAFPQLPMAEFVGFIHQAGPMDKTAWIKGYRAWVREVIVPRAKGQANG